MSQTERFENLLQEFQRVGVDPNTISAGLAVREQDVLRALAAFALFAAAAGANACPALFDHRFNSLVSD